MKHQLLCSALLFTACVDVQSSPTKGVISSIEVTLLDPPPDQLGTPSAPVDVPSATFTAIAVDDAGKQVTADLDVDVFISFGGVKTGGSSACGADVGPQDAPLTTVHFTAGATTQPTTVMLGAAFGSTSLWLDERLSHATGASPTIYFRNPLIDEVQTPADPTAADATFCSPYDNRFLTIDHARAGGQLVVSSVFTDAFVVTDTGATMGYNNIYLYAFGKPPSYIVPGTIISSFSGNYSKFVGFTELNFPLFNAAVDNEGNYLAPDLQLVPAPIPLTHNDLGSVPKLLSASAAIVEFTGTICQMNPPNPTNDPNIQKTIDSWTKYNQFVVDGDGTCDSFTNFAVELPEKVLGKFDPTQVVGQTLDVVGMLQNHSGQNQYTDANNNPISCNAENPCVKGTCISGDCYKNAYNFWTILPRVEADIKSVTPPPTM